MSQLLSESVQRIILQSLETTSKSLDLANTRIRALEADIETQREKISSLTDENATLTNSMDKVMKAATSALESTKKKIISADIVNGLFRKMIGLYGDDAKFINNGIDIVLGRTSEDHAYGVRVEPSKSKYRLRTFLNESCLHIEEKGFKCAGKIVTEDDIAVQIEELREFLPSYLTAERIEIIKHDDSDSALEFVNSLFESLGLSIFGRSGGNNNESSDGSDGSDESDGESSEGDDESDEPSEGGDDESDGESDTSKSNDKSENDE